jgi:hypothetical protein
VRILGIVLSLAASVLLTPVGTAEADDVVVGVEGTATSHAPGYPTTTEPWRSLTRARFVGDGVRHQWTGTATLAGPVPAGSSIVINWGVGIQHPNGCEILIQFAEQNPPVAADNTITMSRTFSGNELSTQATCLQVLFSTNGTTTDQLAGQLAPNVDTSGVEAKPAGRRFFVAAGRTTPTIVMVASHLRATDGATITGTGEHVTVGETRTRAIWADRVRPVVVEVDAEQAGRSRVEISADDDRDSSALDHRWRVVARNLEARRPLPGRYASTDGNVQFRVTHDFEVKRFRVSSVPCEGTSLEYGIRLPKDLQLPRTGATARVVRIPDPQFGDALFGAQLLTVSPERVVGTFAVATYGCTGSIRFVARYQS